MACTGKPCWRHSERRSGHSSTWFYVRRASSVKDRSTTPSHGDFAEEPYISMLGTRVSEALADRGPGNGHASLGSTIQQRRRRVEERLPSLRRRATRRAPVSRGPPRVAGEPTPKQAALRQAPRLGSGRRGDPHRCGHASRSDTGRRGSSRRKGRGLAVLPSPKSPAPRMV